MRHAGAFETLSDRLSKELEDALNQMAQLIGRAQKQQYEIMSLFGKQAAAMEALADLVAKVRNDDVERHNEHATAIEQLSQGQMKIAQFTNGLQPAAVEAASPLKGASVSPGSVEGAGVRCALAAETSDSGHDHNRTIDSWASLRAATRPHCWAFRYPDSCGAARDCAKR